MATFMITLLLCILVYELYIFIWFPPGQLHAQKPVKTDTDARETTVSDEDIMGKSKFNMKAERLLMQQRKEEAERKAAIAKGEMTEDGCEIAQEVKMEDCEMEPKRVWKQVPTEVLDSMFDEPDESGEPLAEGATINDIDLAFNNLGRKDLTEEETRQTVKVLKELEGTEFLDAVEQQFSEVGTRIDELIDSLTEKNKDVVIPDSFEDFKLSDYL